MNPPQNDGNATGNDDSHGTSDPLERLVSEAISIWSAVRDNTPLSTWIADHLRSLPVGQRMEAMGMRHWRHSDLHRIAWVEADRG